MKERSKNTTTPYLDHELWWLGDYPIIPTRKGMAVLPGGYKVPISDLFRMAMRNGWKIREPKSFKQ